MGIAGTRSHAETAEKLEEDQRPRCCDCHYYTGDSGNKPHHVICAVNPMIQPSPQELRKARGRKTEARNNCKDFQRAVPVLGGFNPNPVNSHRCHTFDFDS